MQPEHFVVALTPLPTAARVAKHRSGMRWRVISALISLGILIAITFLIPGLGKGLIITFFVLWGISTAFWLGISIWSFTRAKKDLASIQHGDALLIDRDGLEYLHPASHRARWSDITSLKIAGSSFGAGPNLVMETQEQPPAKIPMSFLDAMPSAIDSAVTAHSLGRVRLDVSEMDRML